MRLQLNVEWILPLLLLFPTTLEQREIVDEFWCN